MISKNHISLAATLITILVALNNSGCGGGTSATLTTTPLAISVSVSPGTATVQAGATAQFAASVTNDSANKGVTWTVTCPATPCGTVSPSATASGAATTYTPPTNPPSAGLTVTIIATSVADTSKSASATIAVTVALPPITVSVAPSTATVQAGATAQFTATVSNDSASKGVTWTVSCSAAPCGTVSPSSTPSGVATNYTAPATPAMSNLTVTLTAASVADTTKSASATITVPSVTVTVAPATATVAAGSTAQFTATVVNDASNKGVTWTLSCSPAPCGTVSPTSTSSGSATTYTAPGTPPPTDLMVTITATSVANPLAATSASITVPAITVSVNPGGVTVEAGSTAQFTATVANDPSNKGVTWAVSCSPAPCGSLSLTSTASGTATTYTAPTAPPPNDLTVTLTATSVADSTKTGAATVTVPAITVSPVTPPSGIIPINATQQFTANVNFDLSNQGLNWTLTQNGTICSPACGTVSPASTASATPTSYTAPATLPTNTSVTINAVSVADTTKSSNATITLTKGTVKLIPANLAFSCKPTKTCPPPAQTITLTNTGTAALAINTITITGTNAGYFSQTNNCGTSVAAAASCAINVTFHPGVPGSFSATVAFNDGSADSPQQVALSGRATRFGVVNGAEARSDLAGTTSAAVPAPTGPDIVGTRVLHLVDATREDPYLANGTMRELAIRLWYPASINSSQDCKPAEYTSLAVWKHFSQLVGVPAFPVTTNSCSEAPIADGVHPVVVFTPGFTATFTDYTFLMEDLASRGYIVVAVAHTYETTAVELSDGRLARSVVGSHLEGPMEGDDRSVSTAVYVRLQDLKFVLNELEGLSARRDSAFAGKLDLSKIAIAGHSLGGLAAFLGIGLEPRFKAVVIMDGFVPAALPSATRKPVFILAAGRERWEPTECRLWTNLEGPRLAVNLRGTEHVALGDWIWLTRNSVQTGPMGPEKTMAAVRDYVAAFLDANLRAMTLDPARAALLTGPSSGYPDAAVTTQNQALDGCPMHP